MLSKNLISSHIAMEDKMNGSEIWNELGNVYFRVGAFDEAVVAYNKAIELLSGDKGGAFSWNRLGHVYRQLHDDDSAVEAYRKAIELDPDNVAYQDDLNQFCVDVNRLEVDDEAIRDDRIAASQGLEALPGNATREGEDTQNNLAEVEGTDVAPAEASDSGVAVVLQKVGESSSDEDSTADALIPTEPEQPGQARILGEDATGTNAVSSREVASVVVTDLPDALQTKEMTNVPGGDPSGSVPSVATDGSVEWWRAPLDELRDGSIPQSVSGNAEGPEAPDWVLAGEALPPIEMEESNPIESANQAVSASSSMQPTLPNVVILEDPELVEVGTSTDDEEADGWDDDQDDIELDEADGAYISSSGVETASAEDDDAIAAYRMADELDPGDALSENDLREVSVAQIDPNPRQPRTKFEVEELVKSVREHGIIQPLIVAPSEAAGRYELIAGGRRLEAARRAGLERVPVIVRQASDQQRLELALIENVQRADLNPLELAEAYRQLAEEFELSHEEIAVRVGKSRVAVTNTLRLLKLTEEVKEALIGGRISEGHARALLGLGAPQMQMAALGHILKNELNVRQAEELARELLGRVSVSEMTERWSGATLKAVDEPVVSSDIPSAAAEVAEPAENSQPQLKPRVAAEDLTTLQKTSEPVDIPARDSVIKTSTDKSGPVSDAAANNAGSADLDQSPLDDAGVDPFAQPAVGTGWALEADVLEGVLKTATTSNPLPAPDALPVEISPQKVESEGPSDSAAFMSDMLGRESDVGGRMDKSAKQRGLLVDTPVSEAAQIDQRSVEETAADDHEGVVGEGNVVASEITDESYSRGVLPEVEVVEDRTGPEAAPVAAAELAEEDIGASHRGAEDVPPMSAIVENNLREDKDMIYIDGAIAAYKKVTEINPNNDRAWDALGNFFSTLGRYAEAITAFEQAISLDPDKEVYHYHLGLVFAAQKHYDEAISAFQRAVELNPDYTFAHCALAGYYRKLGQETEAQKHITIALPRMRGEKEYNRACFEAICGNIDQSIELLKIALEKKQTPLDWIFRDPDLDSIRDDPRFKALVARSGVKAGPSLRAHAQPWWLTANAP
jgi:ParB family chromosome partitioning protein